MTQSQAFRSEENYFFEAFMKNILSHKDRFKEVLWRGQPEEVNEFFKELYDGYLATHDRLVDYCNLLLTFISRKFGEEEVKEAWESIIHTFHMKGLKRLKELNHDQRVKVLLEEHLQHGSQVSVEEHPDRTVILLHCCGSGGRIRGQGRTELHRESPVPSGTTRKGYPWAFGEKGIPYYCTHCSIVSNQIEQREIGFHLEIRYGKQFDSEGKQVGPPCQFILYKERAEKGESKKG